MSETRGVTVTYCERWNSTLHKPIGIMRADKAKIQHDAGSLYSIALGDPTRPDAFIEIRWETNYLGVWFFDEKIRRSLKYTFERIDDKSLFLTEITSWEYPSSAQKDLSGASIINTLCYSQDGTVRHQKKDKAAGEVLTEDHSGVDIHSNYEPVPQFGHWNSVARWNRELPPGKA